ncbi:hypothetical protein TUZN_0727 [Thermoproteus uzoniensis 768-20]|uniref:Uncharacterized protein n=1 Tax=Thermoproteus uzoniensis (strain 768-20) TaxID=999630 RepID=F2L4N9_THEU7|nr:hypothetical protein [Thermoproteus uzoniensis]AEA12217.1 hypothetical protein TUZN_0727 [Thermoproteus uzoniensis 768-20]
MADLAPEDILQDVLRELIEIRRGMASLSKQLAETAARIEARQPPQPPPAPPNVEIAVSKIQEAAERVDAVLQKAVEELAYQREILLEELRKRDALCEALLERIALLQGYLEKIQSGR